jgi:hypothetical protein
MGRDLSKKIKGFIARVWGGGLKKRRREKMVNKT